MYTKPPEGIKLDNKLHGLVDKAIASGHFNDLTELKWDEVKLMSDFLEEQNTIMGNQCIALREKVRAGGAEPKEKQDLKDLSYKRILIVKLMRELLRQMCLLETGMEPVYDIHAPQIQTIKDDLEMDAAIEEGDEAVTRLRDIRAQIEAAVEDSLSRTPRYGGDPKNRPN